jgi:tight adherence protein B
VLSLIAVSTFLMVLFGTLAVAHELRARPARLDARIDAIAGRGATPTPSAPPLLRLRGYSGIPWFQRLLQKTPKSEQIADDLGRSGLHLRVGAYVLVSLALGALLALAVLVLLPDGVLRLLLAAVAFVVGLYLPRRVLKTLIDRRQARFEAALPDALDMISRSLRVGIGLLIAIENVTEELSGEVGAQFQRLQQQIAAGLSIEDAFRELDRRVQSKDLHIAVTAILIQREVGGNLAETLDNVTRMMRERVRLRGELKALTARQVWSTNALAAMPPIILLILVLLAPQLTQALFEQKAGWIVLGIAAVFELIGFVIIRRMAASTIDV